MKVNWLHIVLIFIIGAISMGWGLTKCSGDKQLKTAKKSTSDIQILYTSLLKARNTTIVIHSSYPILYPDSIFPPPKIITFTKTDTSCNSTSTQDFTYGKLSFTLDELIHNCYPYERHIRKLKIPVDSVETCWTNTIHDTVPIYHPKTHYLVGGSLIGSDFKRFPNFDLNAGISLGDIIIIRIGGEYNIYHSELYGKLGIDIILDKRK
jgi:hypothetical protein